MRYLLAIVLIMITIGCSNEAKTDEITLIEPDRVYEISFKNTSSHAKIVFNKARGVDIIVSAKDLDSTKGYEIAIVDNEGEGGVLFGPNTSLDIKMGSIEGETILHPNQNGELYVSMLNPERIFTGAEQLNIVVSTIDQIVFLESYPFRFVNENSH